MLVHYYFSLVLCLMFISSILANDINNPIEIIDVNSQKAVKDAEFAVKELSKLSDSDIYTTLSLKKIIYAAQQDGIFHDNTLLTLELTSPYFNSKKLSEEFKMIVMVHKEDGVKALAIDEFPIMDEDAIEEFYIQKIERRRKQREESFRRLEIESQLYKNEKPFLNINNIKMKENFSEKTIEEILLQFDTIEKQNKRQIESKNNIQKRLNKKELIEELELQEFTLRELYEISIGTRKASDFQIYRARTILDTAMTTLD